MTKLFPVRSGLTQRLAGRQPGLRAVNDVSLALHAGSVLALVGESGSGKSTLARVLARLYAPTSGEVLVDGVLASPSSSGRAYRRYIKSVQLILQDPYGSLSPHHTVGYHLTRPLRIHGTIARRTSKAEARAAVMELLASVGLAPGAEFYAKYPHELSGGQRQRVSIARALAARPHVLIADEPVSMLDVSLRLGVLDLLEAQRAKGLSILYITHDLPSARYFADTIAVMYAGEIVEQGPADSVVEQAAHPYTRLLLAATPDRSRGRPEAFHASGEPPSLIDLPPGCPFHPRCSHARDICRTTSPPQAHITGGHWAKCWLYEARAAADDSIQHPDAGSRILTTPPIDGDPR